MKIKKIIPGTLRLDAMLEVIALLIALFFIDLLFGNGERFINIEPNPLWFILLLVLFQYSINEAFITIVLMCIFLYAWNLPHQLATQSIFEYYFSLSLRPLLWLGTAILLGGLKLRNSFKFFELQQELEDAKMKEKVISDSFTKLKTTNRVLELRLSEELGSAIKIYKAAVTLEDLAPENQIDGVNKIVASILNPEKFSIYLKSDDGLTLSSNYAWDPGDQYMKKFDKNSGLYKAIVGEKRVLVTFNDTSELLLNHEGIIAGPLIDSNTGEVFGMLKIEKMTFQSLNLRTVQLFTLLCEWIGLTLRKMFNVQQMASETINSQSNRAYSYAFLQAQTEFLETLAKRMGFHLTKLNIRMVNSGELSVDQRRQAVALMATAIKSSLRKTDLLFDAREKGEEYALLLCGTGEEYMDLVIKKIQEQAVKAAGPDNPAKYAFSYQVLHRSDRNPTWQGGGR
jgi:hypothetical protein